MKKLIPAIMMSAFVAIGSLAMSTSANAQTRYYDNKGRQVSYEKRNKQNRKQARNNSRNYNDSRYYNNGYYNNGYYNGNYGVKQPNVYDRHRKAVNLAVGTGAGAAIGAAVGGKKGALIGAAAGLATGAIVTKVQKPRNYPRYYR